MIDKLAVKRVLKKIETPQAVYGHFWHCAYFAYYFARKAQLPLFVATGESDVRKENHFDIEMAKDFFKYVSGVICVSNKNKEESVTLGFTTPDKCVVLPNAINPALFYKQDRDRLREKYGYNQSDFIVVFTGTFEHRKGPKRVAQAISLLNNENIKSFFIGRGQDENLDDPNCEGILFKSHLDHKLLPDYLNMADVFCLPTLKEGCCNAIIEALGCGLPIISSDLSFNYDILDDSNSILIDPMNIEQIAGAIKELYDDPMLRARLSSGALKTANKLTIDQRAKSIKFFIETKGKL